MTNMQEPTLEKFPLGMAAIKKLGEVSENFRLYYGGWSGDGLSFRFIGAEFAVAKHGPEAGSLSVMVPNTKRSVTLSAKEVEAVYKSCDLMK